MNKNNLVLEDFAKNNIINKLATKHFNEKEMKNSRDYEVPLGYKVQFVKISNENNLSGYILVKQNLNSVTNAKKHKKAKDSKYEIVFAGLRQPTKNISMDTYKVLSLFVSKYKISDMDICVDGLNEIKINSKSNNQHIHLFDNYVKAKKETKIYRSSFYINNPQSIESDTYKIKRVNVYDKYQKESSQKALNDSYKYWKRVEPTVTINSHLKGVLIEDYIQDVLNLASRYFNANHYDLDYINLQLKLLQNGDARRNKKNIENLNNSTADKKEGKKQMIDITIVCSIDDIVEQIQQRDIKVQQSKKELIVLWMKQGLDMCKLIKEHNCTQKKISKLTGVSVGNVNLYISFASDERLVSMLFSAEYRNTDSNQLERFNQKKLKRLTTLNDEEFNQTITSGVFPKNVKVDKSIELTVEEQIRYKLKHIQQLQEEIKGLQVVTGLNADVVEVLEVLEPQQIVKPKKSYKRKVVNQIDLKSDEIIETFKSLADASKATKIGIPAISKCCNGKQKHAGGYMWKFADTESIKDSLSLFDNDNTHDI